MVADTSHNRCILRKRFRHRQIKRSKLFGCIFQVQLVEDALLIIFRQQRPVQSTERFALFHQAPQVCIGGYLVSRHPATGHPNFCPFHTVGLIQHPTEHFAQILYRLAYRKQTGRLHIFVSFNIRTAQIPVKQPLLHRISHEKSVLVRKLSLKRIIKTITTRHVFLLSNGNHIHTNVLR